MKKGFQYISVPFTALLTVSILCSGNKINNSLSEYRLKGKVKSVAEYCFPSISANKMVHPSSIYFFDEIGNITQQYDYLTSGDTMFGKWDYMYNEKGYKTEENIYNKDGSLSWKTFFTYDKNGLVTETNRYPQSNVLMEKVIYKYNMAGNNITQLSLNKTDTNGTTFYEYDKNGNLILSQFTAQKYSSFNNKKEFWKFNNAGAMIEWQYVFYNPGDSMVDDTKYYNTVFDTTGNWRKRTKVEIMPRGQTDTLVYKREIKYY
jgi:hypothetical protein